MRPRSPRAPDLTFGDWYLALFSIGVGVSMSLYWLVLERTPDRFHFASEMLTALVLLAAGISMLAADPDDDWVVVLSSIGLGLLVYALLDSPGRYRGDRRKQLQFVIGWLFTIPALVLRFTTS
jgi:uncharacterized membrane protein YfcA